MASGFLGTILTSPDATNWTSRVSNISTALHTLAYGAGVFVVAGFTGSLQTSPDGVTWTSQVSGTPNSLRSAIYINSNFVLSGFHGTLISSIDGTNWVTRSSGVLDALRGITYGAGAMVTAGHNGRILRTASLVAPTIRNMSRSGTTASFVFDTVSGLDYSMEYKTNLSTPGWTLLSTTNGTGGAISPSDSSATNATRFYRVGVR